MKTYKLTLLNYNNEIIDTLKIYDCNDRKHALKRVKSILLYQGIKNGKVSLKQAN